MWRTPPPWNPITVAPRKHRSAGSAHTASHYRIRPVDRADLAALAAIERLVFSDPWPASGFQALLGDGSLVVATGPDVVGYVFARVAADQAEILNLAIHPDHRRQGLGRRLLEAAMQAARAAGASRAYLEVRISNQAAQAFYSKMGFRPVGYRRRYYERPPEDAMILCRPLSGDTQPA